MCVAQNLAKTPSTPSVTPDMMHEKSCAIYCGIEALDRIAASGTRLSPQDDVERVLGQNAKLHAALSPAEVREVRAVLLSYAFYDLHRERWPAEARAAAIRWKRAEPAATDPGLANAT